MLCQKQIDNFFDTSYGNKEIFFIKLRVQGLHKNPVKTASAKSDETIFLKYQVYRKEQLYMGKKVLKADTVVKNYWRNNEQFADIFNAVLFNGNKVITTGGGGAITGIRTQGVYTEYCGSKR